MPSMVNKGSMKSNDKIPEDELLLAMALQNAGARKLRACRGNFFLVRGGRKRSKIDLEGRDNLVGCCAIGALMLEQDSVARLNHANWNSIVTGNDDLTDGTGYIGPGYTIGLAFWQTLGG